MFCASVCACGHSYFDRELKHLLSCIFQVEALLIGELPSGAPGCMLGEFCCLCVGIVIIVFGYGTCAAYFYSPRYRIYAL